MKNIRLKKQNGFVASDALIAVLIITLFTGIIATITYNIYLSNASLKRMSKANGYIVDMFEYIDKTYYDDITPDKLKAAYSYLQDSTDQIAEEENLERLAILEGTKENGSYNIKIILDKYAPQSTEIKLDLVKQIRVIISYRLGNKLQTIEMKRIKSRENNLNTPNMPDLKLVTVQEGNKVYPIKFVNNNYIVCEENDSEWYDYENEIYAKIGIALDGLKTGDVFDETNNPIYRWIPRYGKNSEGDIKYYYSNSNKYIKKDENSLYNLLLDGDENGYTLNFRFRRWEHRYMGNSSLRWNI